MTLLFQTHISGETDYRDIQRTAIATAELLKLPDPPTCILFPDDYAAYGGINVIKAAGLRIPEDISVAGYDGISLATKIEPKMTTIKQDTKTMGMLAAEKLIALIEKPSTTEIVSITVHESFCGSDSCKPIMAFISHK